MRVTTDDGGLGEKFGRLLRLCKRPVAVLQDVGRHAVRRIVKSMPVRPIGEPGAGGSPPARHSQDFADSIAARVIGDAEGIRIGSSARQARQLQEGGEIRPRRARMLAIPIDRAAYGKRPRDFGDLTLAMPLARRGGKRTLLLGRQDGSGFQALFVLTRVVRTKPHPWLAFTRDDGEYGAEVLAAEADRAMGV